MQAHPQGRIKTSINESRDQHLQTDVADDALDDERGMGEQGGIFERRVGPATPVTGFHFRNQRARDVPRRDVAMR